MLNAIRGTYKYIYDVNGKVSEVIISNPTEQEGKKSRLTIKYDENLIPGYISFERNKQTTITELNPPKIIGRSL